MSRTPFRPWMLRTWTLALAVVLTATLAPTVLADSPDTPQPVESLEAMLAADADGGCPTPAAAPAPPVNAQPALDLGAVDLRTEASAPGGTFYVCISDAACGGSCPSGTVCGLEAVSAGTSCCITGNAACVSHCAPNNCSFFCTPTF